MTDCKKRRPVKHNGKLHPKALAAANAAVPSPSTYSDRKRWMDAYIAAGGAWECADPAGVTRKSLKEVVCPIGNLTVRVVDNVTMKPISRATVKVVDVGSKLTDANGVASWTDIKAANYTIVVQKESHRPLPLTENTVVFPGEKALLTVNLTAPGKLYFAIYYIVRDNAFKKAAETWRASKGLKDSCKPDLCYRGIAVKTEPQFKSAWNSIYSKAKKDNYKVVEGRLYTHASIRTGQNQGLEFAVDSNDPAADDSSAGETTLQKSEISNLLILPWISGGRLWLHSCNSGVNREGWSPAQVFADRQRVKTFGTMGFAYFSEKYDTHDRHDNWGDDPLYLRAYKRRKNVRSNEKSTGKAIPERAFIPR